MRSHPMILKLKYLLFALVWAVRALMLVAMVRDDMSTFSRHNCRCYHLITSVGHQYSSCRRRFQAVLSQWAFCRRSRIFRCTSRSGMLSQRWSPYYNGCQPFLGRLLSDFFPKIFGKKNENEGLDEQATSKQFEDLTRQINNEISKGKKREIDDTR